MIPFYAKIQLLDKSPHCHWDCKMCSNPAYNPFQLLGKMWCLQFGDGLIVSRFRPTVATTERFNANGHSSGLAPSPDQISERISCNQPSHLHKKRDLQPFSTKPHGKDKVWISHKSHNKLIGSICGSPHNNPDADPHRVHSI